MTKPLLYAVLFIFGVSPSTAIAAERRTSSGEKARMIYYHAVKLPAEAKRLRGSGVLVCHVRPDGSVSRAEIRQSTGHAILDKACVDAFSKCRFAPGSVSEITIPVAFTGNKTRPQP